MKKEIKKLQVIKSKNIIDATGAEPIKNGVIVIEDTIIKQIGTEADVQIPEDVDVIDLSQYTVMPGLMDLHTHLSAFNISCFNNYRIAQLELPQQTQQLYALLHAQVLLEMGFTTIRDQPWPTLNAGHNYKDLCANRDAIETGIFAGPRLVTGGYCLMTGAHLDLIVPKAVRREPGFTADGPWELRKLARTLLRFGVDFVKTSASGGGGTDSEAPDIRNMAQEELDSIVDEAHAFGKICSCHCFTPTAIKMSIRAGVDTIEHTVFNDDESTQMLVDSQTPVIPTLLHRSDHALAIRETNGTSKFTMDKMRSLQPYTEETFKRFHQAGVKLAMGSDTQVEPYMGENAMELEIYVNFGMTPMEAIMTATKNAAEAIKLDKKCGTLEPGKYADIIAIDGDPLKDIRLLQQREKIAIVMKEGRIWVDRRPGFPAKSVVNDQSYGWKRLY